MLCAVDSEGHFAYHIADEDEVPVLRELTKHEVIEFFDKYFSEDSPIRRKLCTMIYANDVTEETIKRRDRVKRSAGGDAKMVTVASSWGKRNEDGIYRIHYCT